MRIRHIWLIAGLGGGTVLLIGLVMLHQYMRHAMLEASRPMTLKVLCTALCCYADENGGVFPRENGLDGLRRLVDARILTDPRYFTCSTAYPAASSIVAMGDNNVAYEYVGGMNRASDASGIIVYEKPDAFEHGIYGAFVDGRVRELTDDDVRRLPGNRQ